MKSIAKPAGGFSLGHTSQRLVAGNSIVSPRNNVKTASATTSERGGQPGIIKSISIAALNGLTLLSRAGTSSLGIIPSGLTVEHELM